MAGTDLSTQWEPFLRRALALPEKLTYRTMITDFRLRVFKTVADRLSFTKAAGELLISQPAVTRHISELERQLRVSPFLPGTGGFSLTRRGQRLLVHANRILDLYGNLNDAFAEEEKRFCGEIRLGASTTIAQYLLPGILASFKRRYPEIRLELFSGNTERIEEQIAGKRLDFGLIEGKASRHSLHYEPFMDDELVLVTSASNSAFRDDETTLEKLRQLPLVIREAGSGTLDVLEEALAAKGFSLQMMHIEMQLGSTEGIKRYLYHSGTFAFLSVQAILDELTQNKLRVVEIEGFEVRRRFSFVAMHGQHGRLVELFKQYCLSRHNIKL